MWCYAGLWPHHRPLRGDDNWIQFLWSNFYWVSMELILKDTQEWRWPTINMFCLGLYDSEDNCDRFLWSYIISFIPLFACDFKLECRVWSDVQWKNTTYGSCFFFRFSFTDPWNDFIFLMWYLAKHSAQQLWSLPRPQCPNYWVCRWFWISQKGWCPSPAASLLLRDAACGLSLTACRWRQRGPGTHDAAYPSSSSGPGWQIQGRKTINVTRQTGR